MNKVSLRVRLIFSVALVLFVSIGLGSVIVYWHAVHKVQEELEAAIDVGMRTVHNATDDVEEAADPVRQLQLLVEDFDGNRHLRARLVDASGDVIASSKPLIPLEPAPEWFNRFIARPPQTISIPLPLAFSRYGQIVVETDSHNEIDEVWSDVFVTLSILAIFAVLVISLIYWTLGRPLFFLNGMSASFACVGSGDYSKRFPEKGPRELRDLAHHFNDMVARLAAMEGCNRRLEVQLSTMQEEERADLARDLHDEIGPLLFALGIDVSTIRKQNPEQLRHKIGAHLDAMQSAISDIQRLVRSMLCKLRPGILLDLGLGPAVDNLVAFWRLRHPHVQINVELARESFDEALDATIYRILQEGLNNAFRHGHPSEIAIRTTIDDYSVGFEMSDNGEGLHPDERGFGFGLTGMRERVDAIGGTLSVKNRSNCTGVIISARFPLEAVKHEVDAEPV